MEADSTSPRTLILASSSPRRHELIQTFRLPVLLAPSYADESVEPSTAPEDIVMQLSLRKAFASKTNLDRSVDGMIIGSDTIVVLNGEVMGKPENEQDAARMLSLLQGRTHEVYTGVACIDSQLTQSAIEYIPNPDNTHSSDVASHYRIVSENADGKPGVVVGYTVSKVTFRPMSVEEIAMYISTGEPNDKAGAYGVQGRGALFIEKIEGDFYSVMGLPLSLLYQMLLKCDMLHT